MRNEAMQPSAIRWYYEGLKEGSFRAMRCSTCGQYTFPPTGCCEHCGSWAVEGAEISGEGRPRDLDGHVAAQQRVVPLVDEGHAPLAEPSAEAIAAVESCVRSNHAARDRVEAGRSANPAVRRVRIILAARRPAPRRRR